MIEYAPKDVRVKLAAEVNQLHAEGWTRPMLEAISGLTPAMLYRITHRCNTHADEVAVVEVMLERIASGEVTQPQATATSRPKVDVDALVARLAALEARVAELEARDAVEV